MFKVGDKAVYPAHGVGIIESVKNMEIAGMEKSFYVMRILENGITVMVPTETAENTGLRDIISEDLVPRVFNILKEKKSISDNGGWNKRYREYSEKLKTGSIFEVAEVMRDLLMLKQNKGLSFRETRLLEVSKGLLIKEISFATNTNENKIEKKIKGFFEH
ncbi:MAG TPA: CarD family transcriptional regulator [bacterium]